MKKFSLILLLAALLLIQVACEKTPDQPINASTQEKSDVTETGGNGTILYEVPNTSTPVPCQPYTTELVVNNNINDWDGSDNLVVGTMTVESHGDFLEFTFTLSPEKVLDGCYITKATGNAYVTTPIDNRIVPPGIRTITGTYTAEDNISSITLKMKRDSTRTVAGRLKDYSFKCGDILAVMGYIQVCCPGNLGSGNGSGNPVITNGIQYLFMGNNDTDENNGNFTGTVEVSIINDNLVITYNITAPNITLSSTHILIAPSEACPFPASGRIPPGQMPFGSHKNTAPFGPGTFTNGNKTWTLEIPLDDFIAYLNNEYDLTIDNICNMDFCISTHASYSNGETAYGGVNKVVGTGANSWYRYFGFTVECPIYEDGDPTCETAWSFGNSRYCLQLPNVEGRYWYWVTNGYTFCCQ